MKFLVTGASGLIGWQLVDRLARDGQAVVAWLRRPSDLWPGTGVTTDVVDLQDRHAVAGRLAEAAPDFIFHLSAQSLPGISWSSPVDTMHANIDGTLNLLEAIKGMGKRPRFLFAGSSSQYSDSIDGSSIGEDTPFLPSSPYAVSKIAAELSVRLYARTFGLDTVHFRPFLLIGPRKSGDVASDIARRIVAIERGGPPILRMGDMRVTRDFLDARDGVEALLILAAQGQKGGTYNICSGEGTSIGRLLDVYRALARVPFELKADPELMRPHDTPVRVGDHSRMRALGWKPRIPLEQTARDILDYWRAQPASGLVP